MTWLMEILQIWLEEQFDKILHDIVFDIAKNPKYDGYEMGLDSVVNKFFDEKTSGGTVKNENMSN